MKKMLFTIKIEYFFFLTCLFPFVSIYPIQSDVQPLSGILAFLIILKEIILNKYKINSVYLLLLFISFIALFYIDPFKDNIDINFVKAMSLLFGIGIFIAFSYSKNLFTSKLFTNVIYIYIFYFLYLQYYFQM